MSIDVLLRSVASVIAAIASTGGVWVSILNARRLSKAKVEIASVKETAVATHILTNSARGQLLLNRVELLMALSVQGHRFAQLTNDAGDLANAVAFDVRVESAKAEYQEHMRAQAVVDARAADSRSPAQVMA